MSTTPQTPAHDAPSLTPNSELRTPTFFSGPPWLPPILHRTQIDIQWLLVGAAMLASCVVFFGWRGMLGVCIAALATLGSSLLAGIVIQLLRPRAPADSSLHALGLGLLLGAALPVMRDPTMPLLAGLILGIVSRLVGRSRRIRIHPVALALVLVWLLPAMLVRPDMLYAGKWMFESSQSVLRPQRVVIGDVYNVEPSPSREAWWSEPAGSSDALWKSDPYAVMVKRQPEMLLLPSSLPAMLTNGELARLGEVLLGCVPGPVGASSRALMIVLGLYLMYRQLSRYPMTLAALAAALAALLLVPLQYEGGTTPAVMRLIHVGPAVATTYLAYSILASPLLFIVMILAPATAPMSKPGRLIYGALLGVMVIALPWFVRAAPSAYLALLAASAFSRPLDALQKSPMAK